MKKSLFALAVLNVVCATAHAQSSVTLYGNVDAGFGLNTNQRVAQTSGAAGKPIVYNGHSNILLTSGSWSGPNWGLRGSENLGQGLLALFKVESGFNIGTGLTGYGGRMFGREAYMGLDSAEYGSVTLGRQYDPIVTYVASIGPGSFTTGVTAHPGDLDNIDNQSRVDNAIVYKSPSLSGFRFGGMYGFGNQAGSMKSRSLWSVGGQYANGPVALGLAYLQANNQYSPNNGGWSSAYDGTFPSSVTEGFATSKNVQIIGAAGIYKIGRTTLGLSYGNTQYTPGSFSVFSSKQTFNAVTLNAGYQATPALRVAVGYGYARGHAIQGTSPSQYHTFGGAAFYALSKRTSLYTIAGYQKVSGKTLDRFGNIVDATATIGDTTNYAPSAGPTQAAVRVGMRHTF